MHMPVANLQHARFIFDLSFGHQRSPSFTRLCSILTDLIIQNPRRDSTIAFEVLVENIK